MIQTGFESRVKVQQVIESQLPNFILDESPNTAEFLKQYYVSQEYQGGVIDIAENLDQYLKLDNLTPEVIVDSVRLSTNISSSSGIVTVTSTKGFPHTYGLLKIDDEIITYTGITTNTFTGCIRGFSGIVDYHKNLNQEELEFSESESASHNIGALVQNLSSLFLKEFYKKLKYTFTPGLEEYDFVSNLNVGNFIKEARSFYQSKGTDESFRILFNILYGVTPQVVNLENFLIKPSSAEFIRREVLIAERISGDPSQLVGQTLKKVNDENTSASISEVEIFTRNNISYFKISLFVGYENFSAVLGNFTITPNTKCLTNVSIGSSVISVDSTIGFPEKGALVSRNNKINYTSKSINQFFGCSGITSEILSTDNIRSDEIYFGYEDGDLTKKVELRLAGVLSKFVQVSDILNLDEGQIISVKNIGDLIENPQNNKTYKEIFANSWIYNTASRYEIENINNFTLKSLIDRSSLKIGDEVEILKRDTNIVVSSSGAYISNIIPAENRVEINNNSGFSAEIGKKYDLRRKINTANSETVPIQFGNNVIISDIQNLYTDTEYAYVASNSLPSASGRDDYTGNFTYKIEKDIKTSVAVDVSDIIDNNYTSIVFQNNVPFISGDRIYYQPSGTPIVGLDTGDYYIQVLDPSNKIKIFSSRSFVGTDNFLTFGLDSIFNFNSENQHKFILYSQKSGIIGAQKLLKKFPLSQSINTGTGELTIPGPVGILINGVEIVNYKSDDKVYYGPLKSINILNGGNDYDVINPPLLSVSAGLGNTALVRPVVRGSIKKVYIDSQDYDINTIVSIKITGGNGSDCVLEPIITKRKRDILFDGRLTTNSGGISSTTNQLSFITDHNLSNGELIVYNSNGNLSIGIGTTNLTLINNSTYYSKIDNNRTIRLYQSNSDYQSGINTVKFNGINAGGIHKFSTALFKNTISEVKVLNGGSGYTNRKLIVSSAGISTSNHTINFQKHGFNDGELVVYSPDNFFSSRNPIPLGWVAVNLSYAWSDLMNEYAIYPSDTLALSGVNHTVYWDIEVVKEGNYTLKLQGDNSSTLFIDGIQVASSTNFSPGGETNIIVTLNKGYHQISGVVYNFPTSAVNWSSNPAGIAWTLEYEPQSVISDLSTSNQYYILKVDSNSFRLCDAGIGGTNISNYNRKNYVRFSSIGTGYQYFSYSDISVSIQYTPVGFGTTTQQVQSLVATPVVKGTIVDAYLYEGGTGYGSTILNLEKKPSISIKNGREARLTPIIISGRINSVNIESSGNDYYSTPDLIITDLTGSGSGADLRPVIANQRITDVKVISAGIGYSSSSTAIQVKAAGSGAILDANIRDLTVNHNVKFGNEILRETENQLQYSVCGYFDTLRNSFNDNESKVSNIIGWAYDGNPIYGPYGYSNPKDSNSIPKRLISGYVFNSSNIIDRPNSFSLGFFVEDYQYTNSGDLDENNGRFGKTPEFPDGVYAYFSTLDISSNPTFPYFIGNRYRSNTIKENSTLNQKFDFNNSNLLRNTLPYKVSDDYAKNDFINEVDQITAQEAIIESVSEGFISGFDIVNSGSNYKVNDVLNFDDSNTSGGGIIARVSSIEGKEIVKIDTSVETYENGIFTYENGEEVKVTIKPNHNLSNNDFVVISGFSTNLSKLNNSYKIQVSSYYSNVLKDIPTSGLTTEIYVTQLPTTVSVGSSISIGGEILSILEVYKNLNILKVERGSTGVSHTATTQINFIPDSFTIPQKIDYFESKVNNKVFFNPVQSVGIGTTPGTTITSTFKFGDSNITRNIPTQGIYIENHPFSNNQKVIFNGPEVILISTSPTSGTFPLPQNVYVTNKNINTIGIKTSLISSEVFFRDTNGDNNDKYSFESTYPQIIGKVERIKSVVSVSTSHELSNQDDIKLVVEPNLSVGIGTSTSIYTKRDLITGNILINPISFNSSGINTETDTILINSHNLKTGNKVLYSANSVASGLSTGFYYVYKVNDNSIKLCETYIDSETIPPTTVNINSTGGANQSISLINPQITSFKNNNLVFNLSDSSLVGYNFKIYYDKDYKNEFISTPLSGIGTIGISSTSSISINYDDNIPTRLYYNLEKSGYISTSDKEVNNYSEILFVDSVYNSNYKISGVGTTTFNISLSKKPEKLTYTLNECDKLQYTTNSLSAKGPIDKINIISGGSGYKKLPTIKGSNSLEGKDAYIIPKSTSIGNAKAVRIIDEGFQYSSDKTLQPIAAVSPLIIIKNSNTIDSVIVTNGGRGYTDVPSIVIVNTETGEKINSGILEATLSGNTINSVNIIQKPKGIPETAVGLYATNNTNGISIQQVQSNSTGIFTCSITTPTLGFSTFVPYPFSVGDKVFVEGIQKSSIEGTGFNSEDYGYKFFEIDSIDTTGVLDTVTFDISKLTTNAGIAKTVQDSIGNIIKSTDYPAFNITKISSSFNIGEKLISNGIERDLKISSYQNSFIKVSGRYELSTGEVIIGKESGNIATVDKIKSGFGKFNVDYSVEKSIGWSNDVGKLDQDNQVIPDNDYYQNLSYTIKSPITYQELRTPVNSLVHSSGLKNFADTGITSTTNSGITTSENATTIFYDIIEENRVDTIYDFDLVKDIDVVGTSSKFLKLKNKKLTDYIECKTNVVLKIDNINRQFSDADGNPSEFINLVELNSGESYINLLVRISTADNSQIQLSEIIILDNGNDLFLAEKSTIVNTGTEIIHFLEETTIGEFLLISDDNNDNYLRFVPKDPFNTDYDIKLINTNFNSDLPGIGTLSVGFVNLNSCNRTTTSGIQTSIISVQKNKFSSLYSNVQIIDSVTNQMNFAEVYLNHNGIDDTYISEYYFDSEFSSNFYSGNNIGIFTASISPSGILSLDYISNSPNIVNIRSKVVGFGTTSIGTDPYRFISPGEIPGNERSAIYQSNYSSTVSSASTIISLDKSDFNAVKSLVEVSVGSTSALHQIMLVQDETNIYVQQLPFLSVGSTNGIGTFGGEYSGSNFILKFYPDPSVTSKVNILSFNQCLYTIIDTQNTPPSLNYGDVTEFIDIKQYNAINGTRINRTDFDLKSNNIPIFAKTFNPTSSTTLNPSTGVFTIQNHFFSNLEKLIYTPKSTFIGVGASAMEIGAGPTLLPSEVYAIVTSDTTFKLATTKSNAISGIGVTFTSYGSGNAHQLEMDKKLEKSLITIDNIVQYPLIFTTISYNLSENGGQIGAGSSVFALSGISTIVPKDILKIDNEYMGVINVGLGTTNIGPITNSGSINLVEVNRGFVGSSASTHTDSTLVRIYKGSYNIVDGSIFFAESPRGNPQIIRDSSNLTFETSDFTGRVFLRNNYTSNQLYDDISNQFTGIGKTFTLTVGGANTVGLGSTGGNGILFINGVFQTPTTINNPENNFSIIENTVASNSKTYNQVGILTGSLAVDAADYFGHSVATSADGKTIIVGAVLDETGETLSTGVVYVYDRVGNSFNQVGILTGSFAVNSNDNFGHSVATSADGKTIVVGAYDDEIGTPANTGLVYVFDRVENSFNQVGILTGSLAVDGNDRFGFSVATSADGKTIIVGATQDEIGATLSTGVVYVYDRVGNSFNQVGILTGSLAVDLNDYFGHSVATSADGKTIVVGTYNDEIGATASTSGGVVYVFDRVENSFNQVGILTGSLTNSTDVFGWSVATSADGKTIIVSAYRDEIETTTDTGVVYVFDRVENSFNQVGILTGSLTNVNDNFGWSVATSADGKTIVVGADFDEIGATTNTGVAYVFNRQGNLFNQVGILTGSLAVNTGDHFGTSVATSADGKTIVVGAYTDEIGATLSTGVVYVFDQTTETYVGISSVVFSGIRDPENLQIITSEFDVNQNQTPRGGIIISLGSSTGLGYAPLVGAAVTAVVGAGGSIVSVGLGTTDNLGSGYNGIVAIGVSVYQSDHIGDTAIITASVGVGGTLSFNVGAGGTGYTNPKIFVSEPSYENLDVIGISRLGIGTTTDTGIGLLLNVEVGASSTTGIGSTYFEVSRFSISRQGYSFRRGDVFKPVGLMTARGLTSPLSEFRLTVVDTFSDSFAAWQFGEFDYIDSIKNYQDGVRTRFPLFYNNDLLSFEAKARSQVNLSNALLIVINGVIQDPGVAYQFEGGTSFVFTTAPRQEDNVAVFFYRGTAGDDTELNTSINETLKRGDIVQVLKNNSISGTLTQNKRTIFDLSFSDKFETNLYSDQGVDTENYKPLSWIKQKIDRKINGENVYKSRDSIESLIYPTTKIIKDFSSTDTEVFVDDVKFFKYDNIKNDGAVDKRFSSLIVGGSPDPVSAGVTAVVSAAGTIQSLVINSSGSGYIGNSVVVKISSPPKIIEKNDQGIIVSVGSTATATFTVDAGGAITTPITITNPGFGYIISDNVFVGIVTSIIAATIGISTTIITGIGTTGIVVGQTLQKVDNIIGSGTTVTSIGTETIFINPKTLNTTNRNDEALSFGNYIIKTSLSEPKVIVPLPDPIYENISQISLIDGFSGIITGITTSSGSNGNPLALRFYLNSPSYTGLQTGYPIYIFDTRIGNGVTSIDSSNSAVVGIGTTFVDNVYYIHQFSLNGTVGIITCNIRSNTSVVGLSSSGSIQNPVGKYSWGRLSGFTRSSSPISIGVSGNTVDVGLSTFPTIQRRGIGIRQTGALPKLL